MVDSHSHLYFPEFDQDRDEVIKRARKKGVFFMAQVGASLEDSRKAIELANQHSDMVAAVGMHPHDAHKYAQVQNARFKMQNKSLDDDIADLRSIAIKNKGKVVAVGECGLDFGKSGEIGKEEKKAQIELFEAQIALAQDLKLPLIIHCRNAHRETAQMIQDSRCKTHTTVIHCFTGNWEDAVRYLNFGCFISFSGIVTFKKAEAIQEAAIKTPLNQMLIETDAPYLSPEPNRGKRNEPANISNIIQVIARLRGLPFEEIEQTTDANSIKFFKFR